MNVLIVHAHNEPKSFNSSMKNLAREQPENQGYTVQVSDLYEMRFNPVATGDDFLKRIDPEYLVYALEQRNAYKQGGLDPEIGAELEKVKWADFIIFNFPIYWFGMPAIMKGWIDRVFVSGYCYGGTRFYDYGGLRGKKAMLSFTIGSQKHMFGSRAVHGELEAMIRPIQRGILGYLGFTVLPPFVAFHVPYISHEARVQYLRDYQERLQNLDRLTPLEFPSLDDFDEKMHPLYKEVE